MHAIKSSSLPSALVCGHRSPQLLHYVRTQAQHEYTPREDYPFLWSAGLATLHQVIQLLISQAICCLSSLQLAQPANDANIETAIQAAGIKDDDWMQKLLEVDKEQLIQIVSQIVNKSSIDIKSIKKAQTKLPSFSVAKWIDFAARAGLPEDPSYLELEYFETPVFQLPPSFHKAVFKNAWCTQDVYQEVMAQTREESIVRILDPVHK
jgi:hypothetical protein